MYIVPDRLELQFSHIRQGYFSLKGYVPEDKLNILCNWICYELIARGRSWLSIRKDLQLEEDNPLEPYFFDAMGFYPQEYADHWKIRDL